MAGGFNKAGAGLPAWLVEANATTRREAAERAAAIAALRPSRPTHVWVTTAMEGDLPVQTAGLLLDWRRRGAGWEALVVLGRGGDSFVQLWLDAEQVEPTSMPATAGEGGSVTAAVHTAVSTSASTPSARRSSSPTNSPASAAGVPATMAGRAALGGAVGGSNCGGERPSSVVG